MYPYDSGTTPYQQSQQFIQNQLQQMLNQQPSQQQQAIHTTKVNGRAGAEAFYLPPNSDTLLLDMNNPIVWSVQTDGAGYKTVIPFDISQHKEVKQEDVLNQLESRISKLEEVVSNGKSYSSNNNAKPKSGNFNNDAGSRSNDKG